MTTFLDYTKHYHIKDDIFKISVQSNILILRWNEEKRACISQIVLSFGALLDCLLVCEPLCKFVSLFVEKKDQKVVIIFEFSMFKIPKFLKGIQLPLV